jgi:hypothetical protein
MKAVDQTLQYSNKGLPLEVIRHSLQIKHLLDSVNQAIQLGTKGHL